MATGQVAPDEACSEQDERLQLEQRLVARFAPALVLYPELSRDRRYAEKDRDYHPRDISLVLANVAGTTKHKGSGVPAFVAGILAQWPIGAFLLGAYVLAFWLWTLLQWEYLFGDFYQHFPLRVTAGVVVCIGALLIFGAASELEYVVWRRSQAIFFVLAAADIGLACFLLVRKDGAHEWRTYWPVWVIAISSLEGFVHGALVMISHFFTTRRRSASLLPEITSEARDLPLKARRAWLVFTNAGAPRDPESHYRRYVGTKELREKYPLTLYAYVHHGPRQYGRAGAIQYWIPYFYNDWAAKHEMDWEQITVVFSDLEGALASSETVQVAKPSLCAFSQHFSGTVLRWRDVLKYGAERQHPVVYVARGSHANYPRPGSHRPEARFAGLRFTGRDLSVLGRNADDYVDHTLSWSAPEAVRLLPNDYSIVNIPPPDLSDTERGEIWLPKCDQHSHSKQTDFCALDFSWLNLKGAWGFPGGPLGGDGAPLSPPSQSSWKGLFSWLDECERFSTSLSELALLGRHAGDGAPL